MKKLADIVIPVFNRWELTEQTIHSLFENTKIEDFNLYVVNDKSDEKTTDLLHRLKGLYPFTLIENEENIGPAASRNFVCNVLIKPNERSKYLYHSDNDVFFKPVWLEILVNGFTICNHYNVKVLGGSCHPYLQNKEWINHPVEPMTGIGIKDAVSGYSQLMTWETWNKYGPFDENQGSQEKKIMGSEDWAFCQRIVKDGFLVGSIEPEVVIPTGKTNTYGDLATGSETFKDVEGVKVQ